MACQKMRTYYHLTRKSCFARRGRVDCMIARCLLRTRKLIPRLCFPTRRTRKMRMTTRRRNFPSRRGNKFQGTSRLRPLPILRRAVRGLSQSRARPSQTVPEDLWLHGLPSSAWMLLGTHTLKRSPCLRVSMSMVRSSRPALRLPR